jgi:AcrR family transcriptional regulator
MSAGSWAVDRLVHDVARVGARGLPREEYYAEVTARLRRVVPSAATCWHTIDPQTRLLTSDSPHELVSTGVFTTDTVTAAGAGIVASEYFVSDLITFASPARKRVPVGTLSQAAAGRPQRSTRYQHVLAPAGIPHELRAAFVTRGRCWGAVHIARLEGHPDFTAAEVDALASITSLVAEGIRSSLRFDAGRRSATGVASPGLVLLGPRNEVELITSPAHELLEAMRSGAGSSRDETPPAALLALAAFTRGTPGSAQGQALTVAVPAACGWITLHASLPDGAATGRVAIVLERSERMIVSASVLIRERGARATSIDDVLEHSGAPRGSVYHHFPGGREQLLRAATDFASEYIARRLERVSGDGPLAAIEALYDWYRECLIESDFRAGCPVVAVAVESPREGPDLSDSARSAFERWRRVLASEMEAAGIDAFRADELGMLVLAAFEGALILSRTYRDLDPLDSVRRELRERVGAELAREGGSG